MTDEPTPSPSPGASAGDEGPDEGARYRPPRWAWFILLGLASAAVVVPALAVDRSVVFADDFSGSSKLGRWTEDADPGGSMGYRDGVYRISVTEGGQLASFTELGGTHGSIRIEVDAAMTSGNGGLSILCTPDVISITEQSGPDAGGAYYDFFLAFSADGYAILRSDNLQSPLAVSPDTQGVLRDGVNRVGVECVGAVANDPARLSLTINGKPVLEYLDHTGAASFDGVGLTVYGEDGAAEAAFDNIKVSTT
jgi:hypothetical protein